MRSGSVTKSALLLLALVYHSQAARFYFPNFQNRPHLNLNGDSRSHFGELVLTLPKPKQGGAVWFDQAMELKHGFSTWFDFHISKVADSGGEGFAFVLQKDNPYALGKSGNGIGYEGLEKGLAVEFDTKLDEDLGDKTEAHVSVHSALEGAHSLSSKESTLFPQVPIRDLKSYFDTVHRARRVEIVYHQDEGSLEVLIEQVDFSGRETLHRLLKADVGKIQGKFYVGFTAATGTSYAQFAIRSWSFKAFESSSRASPPCSPEFAGPHCAITNTEAAKECPRRTSCNVCVEDVYNCAWCSDGSGSRCVVGTMESTAKCKGVCYDPEACGESLTRIWMYMFFAATLLLMVLGFFVMKMLPVAKAFRILSLVVATIGGSFFGMFVSFIVSVSLVEISETPIFAISYGIFFFLEAVIVTRFIRTQLKDRSVCTVHSITLCVSAGWIFVSGVLCIILDKRWVHWLPEKAKILFYMILGTSLNFCLIFSMADLGTACFSKLSSKYRARYGIRGRRKFEDYDRPLADDVNLHSIMHSSPRILILGAASIVSGLYFGFMFGLLRIEEESSYRVALALQQETAYTYPFGACIGGLAALVYQVTLLPLTTDENIEYMVAQSTEL